MVDFDKIRRMSADQSRRIHFIGVGGVSMSSLATMTAKRGATVSGSDREESERTESLILSGVDIYIGHRAENVSGADLVVYSHAIAEDNPEMREAERLAIPTVSRAEYLGALMLDYSIRIGVSASHGKSTTVAMLDLIFADSGVFPTVLSGAELTCGSTMRLGSRSMLIYEACEYKDSFLRFSPHIALALNLELDHTDYFADIEAIKASFTAALNRASNLVIMSGDDENLRNVREKIKTRVLTFGRSGDCDYVYRIISYADPGFVFSISRYGIELGRFKLNIPGEFNVHNAVAAIITALEYGIDISHIAERIASYGGIARRMQRIGSRFGREVFYDYAHHPTEIAAVINALKMHTRMPITVIFKPHTFSRTEALWDELCSALSLADHVILTDIFPAREKPIEGVNSKRLAEDIGKKAIYSNESEILKKLDFYTCGAIVLMGAGDFGDLVDKIII